jgi:hypothetical protein
MMMLLLLLLLARLRRLVSGDMQHTLLFLCSLSQMHQTLT